jgi:hypothetical protein
MKNDQAKCYNDGWVAGRESMQEELDAEREKREQAEAMMLDAYDKAKAIRSELESELAGPSHDSAPARAV